MSRPAGWFVRASWPVLAGAWGAWLGAQGYRGLPHNADSFASMFALAFFGVFALVGLGVGALTGAWVGRLAEKLVRRLGVAPAIALALATVVVAVACWSIGEAVQAKYPGLRRTDGGSPAKSVARPVPRLSRPA